MKVLFVSNTDGALYIFRRQLLQRLLDSGCEVVSITCDGPYVERLAKMGITTLTADFAGTSAAPAANFRLLLELRRLIAAEKPDVVHNFTHKPAVFGTLAARLSGVSRVFITITGLGKLFCRDDVKTRLLRLLLLAQYRTALPFAAGVFFLNGDDRDYFVGRGLLRGERAMVLDGEGVDLQELQPLPPEETARLRGELGREIGVPLEGKIVVLLNARALKEKGVHEFYRAASAVSRRSGRYVFLHLGLPDPAPSAMPAAELAACAAAHGVHYLGFKENVLDYIAACDVSVLPSTYREGVPRSLIEALALDRFIITTDTPGCRETLQEGWNGLFCRGRDADHLAATILRVDGSLLQEARGRSRELCERRFDVVRQIEATVACYTDSPFTRMPPSPASPAAAPSSPP